MKRSLAYFVFIMFGVFGFYLTTYNISLAQDILQISDIEPDIAVRGQTIQATGTFPVDVRKITVKFYAAEGAYERPETEEDLKNRRVITTIEQVQVEESGKSFSFPIPLGKPLGIYDIAFEFQQEDEAETLVWMPLDEGLFRLQSLDEVSIDTIKPEVVYLEDDKYSFAIIGTGFSPYKQDNALYIGDERIANCGERGEIKDCVEQTVTDNGRALKFDLPDKYGGQQNIRILVGGNSSTMSDIHPILLATGNRWLPTWIGGIVALIIIIVILLFSQSLFFETETSSYSLSRFQFVGWTATGLFSLIYLFVAKWIIQGSPTFIDVPGSFPFLIVLPGAALAGGALINSTIGTKGSNLANTPQISDLVSSGGNLAPDRLQLFIFTILGIVFYLLLVIATDPGTIRELPDIPATFLALFGTSAAVYLGVKGAKGPGPTITGIDPNKKDTITVPGTSRDTLEIRGAFLSPEAQVFLGEIVADFEQPSSPQPPSPQPQPPGQPLDRANYQVINKVPESNYKELSKYLVLSFNDPPSKPSLSEVKAIKIRNPDGQQSIFKMG